MTTSNIVKFDHRRTHKLRLDNDVGTVVITSNKLTLTDFTHCRLKSNPRVFAQIIQLPGVPVCSKGDQFFCFISMYTFRSSKG